VDDETMLDEIERLRATLRDLWQEHLATHAATADDPGVRDADIAARATVDVDTVRAFLVSESARGITLHAEGHDLSVTAVEPGYGP
jgi:hypothetical protein